MTRPMAWLTAREACCRYHSSESNTCWQSHGGHMTLAQTYLWSGLLLCLHQVVHLEENLQESELIWAMTKQKRERCQPYLGVNTRRKWYSCYDDRSAVHVSKVQSLTHLCTTDFSQLTAFSQLLPQAHLSSTHSKEGSTIVWRVAQVLIKHVHSLQWRVRPHSINIKYLTLLNSPFLLGSKNTCLWFLTLSNIPLSCGPCNHVTWITADNHMT